MSRRRFVLARSIFAHDSLRRRSSLRGASCDGGCRTGNSDLHRSVCQRAHQQDQRAYRLHFHFYLHCGLSFVLSHLPIDLVRCFELHKIRGRTTGGLKHPPLLDHWRRFRNVKKSNTSAVVSEIALPRVRSGVRAKRRTRSLWPAGNDICIGAVQGDVTKSIGLPLRVAFHAG